MRWKRCGETQGSRKNFRCTGKSRRTNTPPRINQKKGKSGERKGGTLAKTRAKRYVADVVGKVALVTLLVLQEYFY
jgi:hypothetical protein